VPGVSIRCDWSCGYETVTAQDAHIPNADRGGSSVPRLLWRRGLVRNPADQPEHGRASIVNGSLISLLMTVLCPYFRLLTVW
jgi:hypothetical protein